MSFKEKKCLSMDFINKKIISCIFGFYNMFVKSKGYWPIFQKYQNLIFENSYYSLLIFGYRNPKGLISKILAGIICYSLLIFG